MTNKIVSVDATTYALPAPVQAVIDQRAQATAQSYIPATAPQQALIIGNGTATLPIRPATANPVLFNTTSNPPLTGTTAGGTTGRVSGLDMWIGDFTGGGSSGATTIIENPIGSGTYANRPATSAVVSWKGVIPPSGGGTTAGGTPQMVNNLDEYDAWVVS